jgi:putative membrane protein insertion efficiency factor
MRTILLNIWLLPRNTFIGFILIWRKIISPLYGDVCRFYPSCSAYGLGSIQQQGFVKGSVLTLWRILRCNPFAKGGVDEVRPGPKWLSLTKYGFVVSQSWTVASEKDK